ncbi:MAG: glycosyltransferase [Erysipelotrichaceae bacterium]|nr:glycosyltransferase [Erysipelotrichaceae bacterium]
MSQIKVSVIIPIYNAGEALKKCLDDLVNQTLKNIEIICVNDGSSDNSKDIMEEYAQKDDRIICLNQENSGAAIARNNGRNIAKGEYLSFLDADDFYEPNMLEVAYENCKKYNADMCIFRGDKYDQSHNKYLNMDYALRLNEIPCNPFTYKDVKDVVFYMCVGWAWDKLYKREFVEKEDLKFQNLRTSNDLFFVFTSLMKANKIVAINEKLVHHRVNASASLSVTREKSWHCFYEAAKALKEELIRIGKYHDVEKSYVRWLIHFSFWNLDTIEGSTYKNVYNLIRDEILPEINIHQYEDGYISKGYYQRCLEVEEKDCDAYVYEQFFKLRKNQNKKNDDGAKRVKNSTTYKVGKAVLYIPNKIRKIIK